MSISRFRSTAAFTQRSRVTVAAVERATFVVFTAGGMRLAAPVERVERVLRRDSPMDAVDLVLRPDALRSRDRVTFAGRELPVLDFGVALGGNTVASPSARLLVLSLTAGWVAAAVDTVHEIATVDATAIAPIDGARQALPRGVRGSFVRHGMEILVLDVERVLGR